MAAKSEKLLPIWQARFAALDRLARGGECGTTEDAENTENGENERLGCKIRNPFLSGLCVLCVLCGSLPNPSALGRGAGFVGAGRAFHAAVPVFLQTAIDGPRGDAEQLRTKPFVATDVVQRGMNHATLDLGQRRADGKGDALGIASVASAGARIDRQVFDFAGRAARQDHRSLDGVFQLA